MSSIGDPTLDPLRPPELKSGPGWARFDGTETPEEVEAMMAQAMAPVRLALEAMDRAFTREEAVLVIGPPPWEGPAKPRYLRSAKTGTIHVLESLELELGRPLAWRTLCPSGRLISGELLERPPREDARWCANCGEASLGQGAFTAADLGEPT